ncbi:MAG: PEP-CTERM sorting domain-containing protein [Candidatus Sulfotelmatobacter sp.]
MPDPENGNVPVLMRRRRTRRHRRNHLLRRWSAAAVFAVLTAAISCLALMYFSPSLFRAGRSASSPFDSSALRRSPAISLDQILSHAQSARPVYPYSVVPGGFADARELQWVAEHDPVVAAHYAGFDYARAQVVRLTLARTAYVSYRIGNHIYWTRRRLTLHKGETLITDGKITGRTRCGNRVSETRQLATSPSEPSAEKFDQPIRGTATQGPPVPFQSALLNRPAPGLGPLEPLSLYNPFVPGNWVPISPPPLPVGLCGPVKKKKDTPATDSEADVIGKKKKVVNPCASGGGSTGTVPEPATWILFASGLFAIYWQARRKISGA